MLPILSTIFIETTSPVVFILCNNTQWCRHIWIHRGCLIVLGVGQGTQISAKWCSGESAFNVALWVIGRMLRLDNRIFTRLDTYNLNGRETRNSSMTVTTHIRHDPTYCSRGDGDNSSPRCLFCHVPLSFLRCERGGVERECNYTHILRYLCSSIHGGQSQLPRAQSGAYHHGWLAVILIVFTASWPDPIHLVAVFWMVAQSCISFLTLCITFFLFTMCVYWLIIVELAVWENVNAKMTLNCLTGTDNND